MRIPRRTRQPAISRKPIRSRYPTWKVRASGSWIQLLKDAGLSPREPAAAQSLEVPRENASSPSDMAQGSAQPLKAVQETVNSPSDSTQDATPADTFKIRKSFMKITVKDPNAIAKGGAPIDPTALSIIMEGKTGLTLCFLDFQMEEGDAIEKKAFTLCHLNLAFAYWYFPNRLTPIDSLRKSIKSEYVGGQWLGIRNILEGELGRDIDGEQKVQFTMEFSKLSYKYKLYMMEILEKEGYCALDRGEWITSGENH